MANYEEVRVKITNTQLNKLKSTAKKKKKKKIGTTLSMTKKNFQYEEVTHELLLITRKPLMNIPVLLAKNVLSFKEKYFGKEW